MTLVHGEMNQDKEFIQDLQVSFLKKSETSAKALLSRIFKSSSPTEKSDPETLYIQKVILK
jgi:hypothetical protein